VALYICNDTPTIWPVRLSSLTVLTRTHREGPERPTGSDDAEEDQSNSSIPHPYREGQTLRYSLNLCWPDNWQ